MAFPESILEPVDFSPFPNERLDRGGGWLWVPESGPDPPLLPKALAWGHCSTVYWAETYFTYLHYTTVLHRTEVYITVLHIFALHYCIVQNWTIYNCILQSMGGVSIFHIVCSTYYCSTRQVVNIIWLISLHFFNT